MEEGPFQVGELMLDLSHVQSVADQTELFLAGVDMSTGQTGFPSLQSLVYWTQDGGQFLQPFEGSRPVETGDARVGPFGPGDPGPKGGSRHTWVPDGQVFKAADHLDFPISFYR